VPLFLNQQTKLNTIFIFYCTLWKI
jgi:hypothetical protein